MTAPRRTYALHEIAQVLGYLRRARANASNAWWQQVLADATAIVEQLATEGADAAEVLIEVRRWFTDSDGSSLLPPELDRRACTAIAAARGLRTLARPASARRPTQHPTTDRPKSR